MTSLGEATSAFVAARPRLFGIAYRMPSSAAEAEARFPPLGIARVTRFVAAYTPRFLVKLEAFLGAELGR
ncbi:hypothetical protein [Actinomadura decatromicini]|uniref:hypothetical protein n=1 Tax=Actinomadura decatromicini TaxID=2604572 RepID=UPI001CA32002|nr:hypothetical protein [Actinomadura decatromicini]